MIINFFYRTNLIICCSYQFYLCAECHPPVSEPPPPPVNIQTSCDLVTWHKTLNTSCEEIVGYEIRLVNLVTHEEVVDYLDASATFYSLENVNETLKNESTSVQVSHSSHDYVQSFLIYFGACRFECFQVSTLESLVHSKC